MKHFQKLSDWASVAFGTPWFTIFHVSLWSIWFFIEPYPFMFLTLIVSLESILLSGLLLNATNRQGDEDRRIITKDLKLDQATHNHIEELRRHISQILEILEEEEEAAQ